jgi:hypothetical protein
MSGCIEWKRILNPFGDIKDMIGDSIKKLLVMWRSPVEIFMETHLETWRSHL